MRAALAALLLVLPGAVQATTLHWTGTARIFAGERTIDIGMSTTVTPFASARSDSWLTKDGTAKTNSLIIEGGEGWIERAGTPRTPMPAAMLAHERAQYALYGLMLATHAKGKCVTARHDGAPDTELCFDRRGRLTSGRNSVPGPEGDAPVAQTFAFEGEIRSGNTVWPRIIRIAQDGKPYFELTLSSFEVGQPR